MKIKAEWTDNSETHLELVTVLVLNHRERREFSKHGECHGVEGDDFFITLPFYGMQYVNYSDFVTNGEIVISQWQDKTCKWYEGDEAEINMLESMISDDLAAVKRLANVQNKARQTKPSWLARDFFDKVTNE